MKVVCEYTPREKKARVKVEEGTELVGKGLSSPSWKALLLIDRVRAFD